MPDHGIVIVGDHKDPHVEAVVSRLHAPPMVLDVVSLACGPCTLDNGILIQHDAQPGRFDGGRGWVRRLAPPGWQIGVPHGHLAAAEAAAWLSMLGGFLRSGAIEWLTPIDMLTSAENKVVQEVAAHTLGIPYPRTLVTCDPEAARQLGDRFVVKPLSTNRYFDGAEFRAVYANLVDQHSPVVAALRQAPFICQEFLHAEQHLRVVTVGEHAWVCGLSGAGRPLDWREQDDAHHSFVLVDNDDVAVAAARVAKQLQIGYSSQDWLQTKDATYLLDVNPSGQWLFLPSEVADPVSSAIAEWLEGE